MLRAFQDWYHVQVWPVAVCCPSRKLQATFDRKSRVGGTNRSDPCPAKVLCHKAPSYQTHHAASAKPFTVALTPLSFFLLLPLLVNAQLSLLAPFSFNLIHSPKLTYNNNNTATTMTAQWKPKQALDFDGALLQELQGDVSDAIARQLIKQLPPMTETSVVHDNGCGYGAVTMAIMEANPPAGLQIHATDINAMFLAQLQAKLAENPTWPVKVDTMDAQKLTFADDTFDTSITNFVFAGLSDDVGAASHILRTLKPGGTGAIAVWKTMPWHVALENAHHKTRGADEPMAPFLSKSWYKKEKIEQVTKEAAWKDVKFIELDAYLNLGTDMKRWATIAWTFLGTPVGGWQQRDEDKWDEAVDSIVKELEQCEDHKMEGGIHKIRMVADIATTQK